MSQAPAANKTGARQRGVGLIEVLVAVVLLSIGLLGLAALQTVSLKRSTTSALRTEAIGQSYDLLDRMRANRAQAIVGRYNIPFGTAASGDDLAAADLGDWKAALAASLPDGDGRVLVQNQVVTITVQWSEPDSLGADDNGVVSVSLRTQI